MDNQKINQFLEKNPKHADALKMHSGTQIKHKLNNQYDSNREDEAILQQDLKFDKGAKGIVAPDDVATDKRNLNLAHLDNMSLKWITKQIQPKQTYSDLSVESHIDEIYKPTKVKPLQNNKDVKLHIEFAKEFHQQPGQDSNLVRDNTTQKLINSVTKPLSMGNAFKSFTNERNRGIKADNTVNQTNSNKQKRYQQHNQNVRRTMNHKVVQHNGPSLV